MFLNGFLLASMFYFKMQASYEDGLFSSIENSIDATVNADDTQDSVIMKAMNVCNYLMKNRAATFGDGSSLGVEADFFHPASVDLMTTRGACGSFSMVLARILQDYHFPVRIAQMKAYGYYGAHNIIEVKTTRSWVVLDPTFNISFTRPDGRLASFQDVKSDWDYYARQVPKGYNPHYRYEYVRYSNWTKIPIILPAIKKVLNLFMGVQKANSFSMRTLFLRMYEIYLYLALLLYIPILLLTSRVFVKTKVFPDRNIPLTFRNFIKYFRAFIAGRRLSNMQGA